MENFEWDFDIGKSNGERISNRHTGTGQLVLMLMLMLVKYDFAEYKLRWKRLQLCNYGKSKNMVNESISLSAWRYTTFRNYLLNCMLCISSSNALDILLFFWPGFSTVFLFWYIKSNGNWFYRPRKSICNSKCKIVAKPSRRKYPSAIHFKYSESSKTGWKVF